MIRASLGQIVSSMRHRRPAYLSLVLEVALGCTVVAYILALGAGLRRISTNPIGVDEERTFTVSFEQDLDGAHDERVAREVAALRALRGVEAAAWVELPPLSRRELPVPVQARDGSHLIWTLRGDEHLLDALGLTPTEGRALTAADARARAPGARPVVITRALAARLEGPAVGRTLSSPALGPLHVIGVIDETLRLGPFYAYDSQLAVLLEQPLEGRRTSYIVRTTPDATARFSDSARAALGSTPGRFLAVQRFSDTRDYLVRNVHGADTMILITVFGMLMVVLVGSLGMASSLIVERERQIGVRRALGARRVDIAAHFMLENLLATISGLLLGTGLCTLLDRLLEPLKGSLIIDWAPYLPVAAALFLVSGQLAVFWPARRAAQVAPSVASRAA
jgi:putative ABC transport system permease protein